MPSVFRHQLKFRSRLDLSKSNHLRGGSHNRWGRIRAVHLMCNPMCADCGAVGEEVHHIVPRSVRPELMFDLANLQTLCRRCHKARHRPAGLARGNAPAR